MSTLSSSSSRFSDAVQDAFFDQLRALDKDFDLDSLVSYLCERSATEQLKQRILDILCTKRFSDTQEFQSFLYNISITLGDTDDGDETRRIFGILRRSQGPCFVGGRAHRSWFASVSADSCQVPEQPGNKLRGNICTLPAHNVLLPGEVGEVAERHLKAFSSSPNASTFSDALDSASVDLCHEWLARHAQESVVDRFEQMLLDLLLSKSCTCWMTAIIAAHILVSKKVPKSRAVAEEIFLSSVPVSIRDYPVEDDVGCDDYFPAWIDAVMAVSKFAIDSHVDPLLVCSSLLLVMERIAIIINWEPGPRLMTDLATIVTAALAHQNPRNDDCISHAVDKCLKCVSNNALTGSVVNLLDFTISDKVPTNYHERIFISVFECLPRCDEMMLLSVVEYRARKKLRQECRHLSVNFVVKLLKKACVVDDQKLAESVFRLALNAVGKLKEPGLLIDWLWDSFKPKRRAMVHHFVDILPTAKCTSERSFEFRISKELGDYRNHWLVEPFLSGLALGTDWCLGMLRGLVWHGAERYWFEPIQDKLVSVCTDLAFHLACAKDFAKLDLILRAATVFEQSVCSEKLFEILLLQLSRLEHCPEDFIEFLVRLCAPPSEEGDDNAHVSSFDEATSHFSLVLLRVPISTIINHRERIVATAAKVLRHANFSDEYRAVLCNVTDRYDPDDGMDPKKIRHCGPELVAAFLSAHLRSRYAWDDHRLESYAFVVNMLLDDDLEAMRWAIRSRSFIETCLKGRCLRCSRIQQLVDKSIQCGEIALILHLLRFGVQMRNKFVRFLPWDIVIAIAQFAIDDVVVMPAFIRSFPTWDVWPVSASTMNT